MGSSSKGILCFGIRLEKDIQQPWDAEEFEGDEESWWRSSQGFYHTLESPYDATGHYKDGYSQDDPRISKYYDERYEWDKWHHLPFELRRIGYSEEPSFIIVVPEKIHSAEWDECIEITTEKLNIPVNSLKQFCNDHAIAIEGEPAWWLTSSYG